MRLIEFLMAIALVALAVLALTWARIEMSGPHDDASTYEAAPTPEPIVLHGGTIPVRITSDDAMFVSVDGQILGKTTPVTVLLTEESLHKISLSAVNGDALDELYIWPDTRFVQTVHLQR